MNDRVQSALEKIRRYSKKSWFLDLRCQEAMATVLEEASGVREALLMEPLLHGDEQHRLWLTTEITERLMPLTAAVHCLVDAIIGPETREESK